MKDEYVLKFDEKFKKLNHPLFPTIRKGLSKYDLNDVVTVKVSGEKIGKAVLVNKITSELKDISTQLLVYDTNTSDPDEALEKLRKYYPQLNAYSVVTLYFFIWINDSTLETAYSDAIRTLEYLKRKYEYEEPDFAKYRKSEQRRQS